MNTVDPMHCGEARSNVLHELLGIIPRPMRADESCEVVAVEELLQPVGRFRWGSDDLKVAQHADNIRMIERLEECDFSLASFQRMRVWGRR